MGEKEDLLKEEYDTDCICPYCGEVYDDAWEHFDNDGDTEELECGHCDKTFRAEFIVITNYSTKTIELVQKERDEHNEMVKKYEAERGGWGTK